MKSSVKVSVSDFGLGRGLEPVLNVVVENSDDARDALMKSLFEGVGTELVVQVVHEESVTSPVGLPDIKKTISLRRPEWNGVNISENILSIDTERGKQEPICASPQQPPLSGHEFVDMAINAFINKGQRVCIGFTSKSVCESWTNTIQDVLNEWHGDYRLYPYQNGAGFYSLDEQSSIKLVVMSSESQFRGVKADLLLFIGIGEHLSVDTAYRASKDCVMVGEAKVGKIIFVE